MRQELTFLHATEGNGCMGRIANILYLVINDLLDLSILYMSRFITHNKGVLSLAVGCERWWYEQCKRMGKMDSIHT